MSVLQRGNRQQAEETITELRARLQASAENIQRKREEETDMLQRATTELDSTLAELTDAKKRHAEDVKEINQLKKQIDALRELNSSLLSRVAPSTPEHGPTPATPAFATPAAIPATPAAAVETPTVVETPELGETPKQSGKKKDRRKAQQ